MPNTDGPNYIIRLSMGADITATYDAKTAKSMDITTGGARIVSAGGEGVVSVLTIQNNP